MKNKRPAWTDLAELALLDPALIAHVPLRRLPVHTFCERPKRYTDMMFSVGCHRACPYCYSPVMRGRLRQLSGDRIQEQLRILKEAGYDEIVVQDDDLLKDRAFFKGLLRAIHEAGLTWQDNGGMELELLEDDLVDAIIESGCTSIYVPVNPRQLAERLPTEAVVANVHYLKRLKDAGIYTFTSGIYGVPDLLRPFRTYDDLLTLRDFHSGWSRSATSTRPWFFHCPRSLGLLGSVRWRPTRSLSSIASTVPAACLLTRHARRHLERYLQRWRCRCDDDYGAGTGSDSAHGFTAPRSLSMKVRWSVIEFSVARA